MRKVARAAVSISLWLVTATVLLLCVLVGRLFVAPIDLGFAREQIIERTADLLPGWTVRFSSARVGWDWGDVRPWVVLEDVSLIDRRNRLTARLPNAEVGLGFEGILTGLGVATIEIDRASVHVTDLGGFSDATDTGDGVFGDLFGESGIPKPEIFIPVTEAFNRFALRLMATAPAFDKLAFRGLSLRLYRGEQLSEASFLVSSLDLGHDGSTLTLAAQLEASIGGNPITTRLTGSAVPAEGDLSLVLSLSDFYPSTFPSESGLPADLRYLQFPIGLNFDLDLAAGVGLRSAVIEAEIGEGAVYGGEVFPSPGNIKYGLVSATYDPAENILVVDNIDLDLDDKKVTGDGLLYWHQTGDSPGIQLDLRSTDIPVLDILSYWPRKFHPDGRERGARSWVDRHMSGGNTRNAVFRISTAPSGVGTFFNDSIYELRFDFDGLDTKFVRTMPGVEDVSGSAVLTKTRMDISMDSGTLVGMPVGGSKAQLNNIHVRGEGVGEFNIFVRGDVKTVMGVLDHPPLLVAQKANLDIDRLGGTAVVRARITMPLVDKPPADQTLYDVTAQISDAVVQDLLGGEGLTGGELAVRVNPDTLSAAGVGTLNGVPVSLRWEEDFKAGREDLSADTTLVVLSGNMDADDILALGVDVSDFLHGKAQAEASFEGRNFKFTRGTFAADASTAVLEVPQLAWKKPVGAPATINGGVIFTENGSTVAPMLVQGEGVDLVASFDFGPRDSGTFSGEVQVRELGRHRLVATLAQEAGGPIQAEVVAESFDLGAFLRQDIEEVAASMPMGPGDPGVQVDAADFDLTLTADALLLENGEQWNGADLALSFRDNQPAALTLSATAGEDATPITVSLLDEPNAETGRRPLTGSAANGGQVLRGLGFFAHVEGGALTVEGETIGWGADWYVDGRLAVAESILVGKEALGPAVTEGTVSGLDSYLEDGPLELDVLNVPFVYDKRILGVNGLKANGPTLGLTMEGEVATADKLINVNGVVVPAYGINSLLGNIPIVGGLFTGGEGKGLFGVAYRVKGSTDNPEVSVNTLSGLAPGFLRLLFEGRKGRVADVETPEPTEPETQGPNEPSEQGGELLDQFDGLYD